MLDFLAAKNLHLGSAWRCVATDYSASSMGGLEFLVCLPAEAELKKREDELTFRCRPIGGSATGEESQRRFERLVRFSITAALLLFLLLAAVTIVRGGTAFPIPWMARIRGP